MMSLKKQRMLFGVTLLVSLLSLGCFLGCIFSTDMVHGRVVNSDVQAENFGDIEVGLIWGNKQYNYGYGLRKAERFMVYDEYTSPIKGMTAAVLSFLCVACVFNVVGTFLSLENVFIIPVQTLQGPIGLYLWYSIAGLCAFVAFLMYSILYPTQMKDNLDSDSEPDFTPEVTYFGYGYWLLFFGTVLLLVNVGVVHLARRAIDPSFFKTTSNKPKQMVEPQDKNNEASDDHLY